MLEPKPSFVIYNASAGSGKTFSLVKDYLVKILSQPNNDYYKHLLALTFTNKAVAEMKKRIIDTLTDFSREEAVGSSLEMLEQIALETSLQKKEIQKKAKGILQHLLHHYAQFSVETIDHFNHRIIRTFSKDLNISTNFEVSLDTQQMIALAVDRLIDKIGSEKEITKILVDFSLQKIEEDKSWDISIDLNKIAQLLTNENEREHLESFKDHSLLDFMSLKNTLWGEVDKISKTLSEQASELLVVFSKKGIDRTALRGGYLYDFLQKISKKNFNVNFETAWQDNLESKPLYPKNKIGSDLESIIDALVPKIVTVFYDIKKQVSQLSLYKNIIKNSVPLATINLINKELQSIKEENNVLLISDFNQLIHEQVKQQPAPFIYERLGERYRHFFIDEFQDTSALQWNNLIPLVDNALSQRYNNSTLGSVLIVGDAKQSIYRWRGGLPEQFMNLYNKEHPFSISEEELQVTNLPANYRSYDEIIKFNNSFFSYLASFFSNQQHQKLYATGNNQQINLKKGGYVSLDFITTKSKQEAHEIYGDSVIKIISQAISLGFEEKDICILIREKRNGVQLSEYLAERGIGVVSNQTLLLKNSPIVQCIVYIFQLGIDPKNEQVKIQVLDFLHQYLKVSESKHSFFNSLIKESLSKFSQKLKELAIHFSFKTGASLNLFQTFEYIIHSFGFFRNADAFLTNFMEVVFQFSLKKECSKISFLEYWETQKEVASINSGANSKHITIMTIHKSKGLEFPVVIVPYTDTKIYNQVNPKAWYPWNRTPFNQVLIDYKNDITNYGEEGKKIVKKRESTLELDHINLLYVALTRAVQHLYIIAEDKVVKSAPNSFNTFLKGYLQSKKIWQEGVFSYTFGEKRPFLKLDSNKDIKTESLSYVVSLPKSHHIEFVTTPKDDSGTIQDSIYFGDAMHDVMAQIYTAADMEIVLSALERKTTNSTLFLELKERVNNVVYHNQLKHLFNFSETIYTERDIITPSGILRPDRINIQQDNIAVVVDYKTGSYRPEHVDQIKMYGTALEQMNYTVKEMILVYCNKEGVFVNKV